MKKGMILVALMTLAFGPEVMANPVQKDACPTGWTFCTKTGTCVPANSCDRIKVLELNSDHLHIIPPGVKFSCEHGFVPKLKEGTFYTCVPSGEAAEKR